MGLHSQKMPVLLLDPNAFLLSDRKLEKSLARLSFFLHHTVVIEAGKQLLTLTELLLICL